MNAREIDVPTLMAETDKLYDRIVQKAPDKTKLALTAQKIIEERQWKESLPLYKDRLEETIMQLGYFYVPRIMQPGPAFVFPMRDPKERYTRAQTKPLPGSVLAYQDMKYRYIGSKETRFIDGEIEGFFGPVWLGNDSETLGKIIKARQVMVVEGPFDLLACRLMAPDYPILSPVSKTLGKEHMIYLFILGVKRLLTMMDNDEAGKRAIYGLKRGYNRGIRIEALQCPSHDPSDALMFWSRARQLREMILGGFR